jgi:hypothetical protein
MDAINNTIFALVPDATIPGGGTRSLLFQATFDNDVLHLPTGMPIRSEVIVSFGNATASGNSVPNVDINGNGVIDSDEARIRSVPSRVTLAVPSTTNVNQNPSLTDTLSDITTTGTVTFSNAQFDLGTSSGTVTATINGGTDGGHITNCAHLRSPGITINSGGFDFSPVDPLDLEACDTEDIGGTASCTAGDAACRWTSGDLVTFSQFGFDTSTAWLDAYDSAYGANFGEMEVGIPGPTGFSLLFTSSTRVTDYFVAGGTVGPLNADLINPTTTSAGAFGGEVTALKLNVDLSATGLLGGGSTATFGSLVLCGMSDLNLNGSSVSDILAIASTLLGGGSSAYTINAMSQLAFELTVAFADGEPSTFAQDHLFVGGCPCTHGTPGCPWDNGALITRDQGEWDATTSWYSAYNMVYAASFGLVEVGIPGSGGYSMSFTGSGNVSDYFVQIGTLQPLNADLADPTYSPSGRFGGEVLALQLNVDFSAAGLMGGTSGLSLGAMTLCNLDDASLDGVTVKDVLDIANILLGGGSVGSYSILEITLLAAELNAAFLDGTPSTFAQDHLFVGSCP